MAYKDLNDLYQQVLGRPVDAGGAQYWRTLDVNDENSIDMFKKAAAGELSRTGYKAPPVGQTPAVTQPAVTGQTPAVAGQPAVQTPGATPPYDPNGQPNSIANLYQNVLGRNPDAAGAQFWAKQFGGTTANEAQRQQFIGASGTELSNNASQWQPQTQTYNSLNNQPAANLPQKSSMPSGGKGKSGPTPGYQGASTNSATSGQPQMGQPNMYPNTIGMKDNSGNTTASTGGKGKGA